ncbi:heavy metal-binding domain-containing protein [Streptomyces sp. NPDC005227]|uniref:heavy metal-binding domain-containing protein n=1 Tax=Streptomyces sp. NPDC005227 TaxID=3364707 RepID=UPI0036A41A1A
MTQEPKSHGRDAGPAGTSGNGSAHPRQPGDTWNSGLSVEEFAAIKGAGFEPVGQVLGTAVHTIAYTGVWGCPGAWSGDAGGPSSPWSSSFAPLLRTLYAARRLALSRAVAECAALAGDGVVGVRLRIAQFPAGGVEFTVRGTAVRARSRIRPRRPFTSHLSGQDFAKLIGTGWVPAGLAFGIALATRHDDWRTSRTISWTAGNQEVDGYTRLIGHVRREVRNQLALDARKQGGDGVVVDGMDLEVRERACTTYGDTHDLDAEAVLVGTSVVRFDRSRRPAGPRPLTIMRLERER